MKTRWIKSVIANSKQQPIRLPYQRTARKIAKSQGVARTVRSA